MTESRNIHHIGNGIAVDELQSALASICGSAELRSFQFLGKTLFNVEAEIVGKTKELVVIGAHLDSTAANEKPYDPAVNAAPGSDDNLSGVFGVLLVAEALQALVKTKQSAPTRTIRFVLFNAEEQGMRGSWAYAHDLKELEGPRDAPSVVAMIAMDMIGWHRAGKPPFECEIHGSGPDDYDDVADSSLQLSRILEDAATTVAKNLASQRHPLGGCKSDPATGRSDHTSFHQHGWPACLLSEDLWVAVCGVGYARPPLSGNPDYHLASDLNIAFDYAADIARTVAEAAWKIANP